MANGSWEKCMGLVDFYGAMDLVILEIILLGKGRERENIYLIMEIIIQEVGQRESNTVKGHFTIKKEILFKQVDGNKG